MNTAFAVFSGIMIISFLADGLAAGAGVRWNKTWAWMAGVVCGFLVGIVAWFNGGELAASVGMVIGFIFGHIAGSILFGLNAMLVTVAFGPKPKQPGKPRKPPTPMGSFAALILGSLPILVSIVAAHEIYWMMNMLSSRAQHQVGASMVRAGAKSEDRESLAQTIRQNRWQLDVVAISPLDLLMSKEDQRELQGTIASVDFLERKPAPAKIPETWKASPDDLAIWTRWKVNPDAVRTVPLDHYQNHGARICNRSFSQINHYLNQSWVLRHLPRELFLKKETESVRTVLNRP